MDNTGGINKINIKITSSVPSWIAYRLIKYNNCDSDEIIGYYQTEESAMSAKLGWIEEERTKGHILNGVCCHKLSSLQIERIEISP